MAQHVGRQGPGDQRTCQLTEAHRRPNPMPLTIVTTPTRRAHGRRHRATFRARLMRNGIAQADLAAWNLVLGSERGKPVANFLHTQYVLLC